MQVMPLLRHILENATDRPHALLRAKALECISLVGMAVGRARFRDDAARVMQLMQALQARPSWRPLATCSVGCCNLAYVQSPSSGMFARHWKCVAGSKCIRQAHRRAILQAT